MKSQDLRNSILQYATQGKLVPQFSHEEPANLLLEKIKIEKRTLFSERQLKNNNIPPIDKSEIPFKIPESWCWARLSEISNIGNFKSATKDSIKENDWVLDLEEIESNKGNLLNKVKKSQKSVNSNKYVFKKNNVMYGKLRPYLNKVIVADDDGYCTTEILPLHFGDFVNSKYAKYTLMSPYFLNYVNKCSYGVKMPRLGTKDAKLALFPLPPLEEQNRIVEKIEELFIKVEEYDILEKKITSLNNNFSINMEKSILQYAVQGKLVYQDPSDEPASLLIKKLKEQKEKLLRDKKIKRSDIPSSLNNDEFPFPIPETWEWVKIGEISNFIDYRGKTPTKISSGIRLITAKNIKKGFISLKPEEFISETDYNDRMTRGYPEIGDLFFTTEAPLGNVAINTIEEPFSTAQRLITIQNYYKITSKYMMYCILAPNIFSFIENYSTGTTVKGIKAKLLKEIPIPMPPLNEQQRIVEKIEELFTYSGNIKKIIN
ncbi:restriction endonuclease subunit S [Salinicoccus kekensis]|uniref:Type I restriction enzyme S subunit n=1 Tax=Salinicoccus kekensis TaxID=714307 RepID=A0A285UPU8_9STAP|nr:restriction endonuclease subunit S [Salinicoccus kekensis]SOC43935.1 type I restriction enzyme S subunit [Salinicoccus kekensis]